MRESLQRSRGRGVWGALIGEHWQRYIDAGRLAGTLTLISHRGTVAYCEARGQKGGIAFEGPAVELRTSPVIREKLGV